VLAPQPAGLGRAAGALEVGDELPAGRTDTADTVLGLKLRARRDSCQLRSHDSQAPEVSYMSLTMNP